MSHTASRYVQCPENIQKKGLYYTTLCDRMVEWSQKKNWRFNMKNLGKFQRVQLREFWPDEAKDFTPWLAKEENIEILSNTIDMDIEVEDTEVYIGNYKADIVGRDISNNQKVIIENQLEKSNHDHLGKLITYASGIGASVIIWICNSVTDEHRQAIDWLNENTIDDISFFAIEIELWKIDDSNAAPRFNIICKPNEWVKSAKETSSTKEVKGVKSLQLEYWNYLKDYFNQKATLLSLRTPRAQHWYSMSVGRSKFHISLTINTMAKRLGCELYMRGENAKRAFSELLKEKENIEKELGIELNWQELPDGQDSRIILYRDGDIKERSTWEELTEWFKKYSELFYTVFNERVKKIKL
jgi:hypothetical protein